MPLATDDGAPFPGRDLILFLTFSVILATLVGMGLTLPAVIRLVGLEDDGAEAREDAEARIRAAEAALARLEEVDEEWVREDTAERVRGLYRFRTDRFRARLDDGDDGEIELARRTSSGCAAAAGRRAGGPGRSPPDRSDQQRCLAAGGTGSRPGGSAARCLRVVARVERFATG